MATAHLGFETHYRLKGHEDGRRLVLVHGVGSHLQSWDGVIARLGPGYRCLAYDLRGHGASAKVPGPYAIEDFVADLTALVRHLGWDRFDLAGFSLGGLIGQAFTLKLPAAVRTLTIVSSVAGRTEEERARALKRAETLSRAGAGAHLADAVERWFTDDFRRRHPEVAAARQALSRSNDPACYAAAYRVLAETDLTDRLAAIRCPTLIMTGEDDQGSTPRMARLMADRIAGAACRILPKLRHSVLLEAPEVVGDLMADFLAHKGDGS